MSNIKHRSLLLRGNRFLGSALVTNGLIKLDDQEAASQKLLEVIQADNLKQASLLQILIYELKTLREADWINFLVESQGLGMVDLRHYLIEQTFNREIDVDLCWATWTVPFDCVEGVYFLASAYYMSEPVVKHWESLLAGEVIWFGASTASILDALERISALRAPAGV